MFKEGLIRGYVVENSRINVLLRQYQGAPVIRNVRVVSSPSREIWLSARELKLRTANNSGLWIVKTSHGLSTHREAIQMGVGCKVLLGINTGSQHWC